MTINEYNIPTNCGYKTNKPSSREKALTYGIEALSNIELIMLLLGRGQKKMPVQKLAKQVLSILQTSNPDSIQENLLNVFGMGPQKTSTIIAALECGKRFSNNNNIRIISPNDILPLIQIYSLQKQEHFICISLNGAHEVLKVKVISIGTLNRTLIHPREIFADPITDRAAAIILAHNHPSGSIDPSIHDIEATKQILEASTLLGIPLLDHIIITKSSYYSFRESTDLFS